MTLPHNKQRYALYFFPQDITISVLENVYRLEKGFSAGLIRSYSPEFLIFFHSLSNAPRPELTHYLAKWCNFALCLKGTQECVSLA